MNLDKRLERLEKQLIKEPTILLMPNGRVMALTGPKDYLLTLCGLATHQEDATPAQAAHLEFINQCTGSKEPGGSRLVELIQCFQHGPAKEAHESGAAS